MLLLLVLAAAPFRGQTPNRAGGPANHLPATTGDSLTIVPIDRPDIDCSIQEWNAGPPKPFLTLLCPPSEVFAPLRVYLRLSWMKPEDVPRDVGRVIARTQASTKIRTNRRVVMVRLEVAAETGEDPQTKWVGFNGVVDVALIKDPRRR